MRDNHDGMFELVDAFEKDEHYFVIIEFARNAETRRYQFGVSLAAYRALKGAMQTRPFDLMPGLQYRYFYAGSQKRHPEDRYTMRVRIELNRDATQEEFEIPKSLHANLLWFDRLESLADAEKFEVTRQES